jgi:hypothetical protein
MGARESDSYSGAELESDFEPFGEELLDVLDKILALEGAAEKSEREKWAWKSLQQAAYVSHLALEVHDDATKTEWNTRCYREYRRLLDEESMQLCDIVDAAL